MLPSLPPIPLREYPKALDTQLPILHIQPSPSPSSPRGSPPFCGPSHGPPAALLGQAPRTYLPGLVSHSPHGSVLPRTGLL